MNARLAVRLTKKKRTHPTERIAYLLMPIIYIFAIAMQWLGAYA